MVEENCGYEGSGSFRKRGYAFLVGCSRKNSSCDLHDCKLNHFNPQNILELTEYSSKDFIVFTKGGVWTTGKKTNSISWRYCGW